MSQWQEIVELGKRASKLPWSYEAKGTCQSDGCYSIIEDADGKCLADNCNSDLIVIERDDDEDGSHYWDETARRDFKYIAAACNAAPDMAARLIKAEALAKEWERSSSPLLHSASRELLALLTEPTK